MKTLEDKNRLIAEFMGIKTLRYHEGIDDDRYYFHDFEFPFLEPGDMKYNSSWNWLMPVGKKCKELLIRPKNGEEVYMLEYLEGMFFSFNVNLAFESVVEFIESYNEENKTNKYAI